MTDQQRPFPGDDPGAVKWESDHQRACLVHVGGEELAQEFPYGCDSIEHVARVLLELRKNSGWRPGHTAPKKDGTCIIAVGYLLPGPGEKLELPVRLVAAVTRWNDSDDDPPAYSRGWQYSAPGYVALMQPVWWIPMPEDFDTNGYGFPVVTNLPDPCP